MGDPTNALLFANRAMANLKLEKFELVVDDCSESIKLDSTYFKSYLRRATAYSNLGETDLKEVLKLQPDNREAINELNKLKLVKENKRGIANTNNIVLPVKKPMGKRSKVPLRRIQIDEVKQSANLSSNLGAQASFIKSKETKSAKIEVISQESKLFGVTEVASETVEKSTDTSTVSHANIETTTENFNAEHLIMENNLESTSTSRTEISISFPASTKNKEPAKLPAKPTSAMQFIADWRNIHKNSELVYQYLKQIDPNSLFRLIPHSACDSGMLSVFIHVFNDHFVRSKDTSLFGYMSSLCKVKRFSTLAMFLSKTEKQTLSELFDFVQKSSEVPSDELNRVKK